MGLKLTNNAISRLASSITGSDVSLSVTPGTGALFPSLGVGEYFPATLVRASDGSQEIIKVTARATDVFTIERAQEGTSALSFASNDRIELRLTAKTFTDQAVETATHAATSKATPVDADEIPLVDSAASNVLKKLTWANIKTAVKAYLDTLDVYLAAGKAVIFEGATDDAYETTLTVTDPTADRTITLPDASGKVALEPNYNTAATPASGDYILFSDVSDSNKPKKASISEVLGLINFLQHGHCRLSKSGANLILLPVDGNKLVIDGVQQEVPIAGVTIAPPATNGITYYIYAYMNSGTMTLEASTTGHSTHTDGVEIKTGDATRTLVGMARTVSSAWVDTEANRLVRSYFNDYGVTGGAILSSNSSTTSATYTELTTNLRVGFLCWADEIVSVFSQGNIQGTVAGARNLSSPRYDAGSPISTTGAYTSGNAGANNQGYFVEDEGRISEGYHYGTLYVAVTSGTGTWFGSTSGENCTLKIACKGR